MLQHTNYISHLYRLKEGIFIFFLIFSITNLAAQRLEVTTSSGIQMIDYRGIDLSFSLDYYMGNDLFFRFSEEHFAKVIKSIVINEDIFTTKAIDNYSLNICLEPLATKNSSLILGIGGGFRTSKNANYTFIDPTYGISEWEPIKTKGFSINFFTEYHYLFADRIYVLFNMGGTKVSRYTLDLFHFNLGIGFKIYENKK